MSIDETSLSDGELYTIVSNKDAKGKRGALAAIVLGTKSEDIIAALKNIDQSVRETVTEITFSMMKRDNKIGCLTAIYDTQLLGRKYYMPTLRKRQDWALFLLILKDCKVCYSYPSQPLAVYCRHKHSISSSKISLAKYNIAVYRSILGYGWLKACFYFAFLFLPTYILKLMKRKQDSYCFVKRKG